MRVSRNPNGSTYQRAIGECARCGEVKELVGRGLDAACHQYARNHGTLLDYRAKNLSAHDLVEEYEFLQRSGLGFDEIAKRLGYASAKSLRAQVYRARKRIGGQAA